MVDVHLPFFDEAHQHLLANLDQWCKSNLPMLPYEEHVDIACRTLVKQLGEAGWLRYCVPSAYGGELTTLDSRALCLIRQTLAYYNGLADFSFAMQGLGSGAITLAGSE